MVMFLVRLPQVFIFLNLLSSLVDDFKTRNKVLTKKKNYSDMGIDIIKFVRRFQIFIGDILT